MRGAAGPKPLEGHDAHAARTSEALAKEAPKGLGAGMRAEGGRKRDARGRRPSEAASRTDTRECG